MYIQYGPQVGMPPISYIQKVTSWSHRPAEHCTERNLKAYKGGISGVDTFVGKLVLKEGGENFIVGRLQRMLLDAQSKPPPPPGCPQQCGCPQKYGCLLVIAEGSRARGQLAPPQANRANHQGLVPTPLPQPT